VLIILFIRVPPDFSSSTEMRAVVTWAMLLVAVMVAVSVALCHDWLQGQNG
jgi:hypothetical protein